MDFITFPAKHQHILKDTKITNKGSYALSDLTEHQSLLVAPKWNSIMDDFPNVKFSYSDSENELHFKLSFPSYRIRKLSGKNFLIR